MTTIDLNPNLAIVQVIVEKHGGLVGYEALTRGSKFWIELPEL